MASRLISQAEARRLRARVEELEQREKEFFGRWTGCYPGGIHLRYVMLDKNGWEFARLQTARRLGCALIGVVEDDGKFSIYGVPKE